MMEYPKITTYTTTIICYLLFPIVQEKWRLIMEYERTPPLGLREREPVYDEGEDDKDVGDIEHEREQVKIKGQ